MRREATLSHIIIILLYNSATHSPLQSTKWDWCCRGSSQRQTWESQAQHELSGKPCIYHVGKFEEQVNILHASIRQSDPLPHSRYKHFAPLFIQGCEDTAWQSTWEQGARLVGRTGRSSRARRSKGAASEWGIAMLPPHGKGNYKKDEADELTVAWGPLHKISYNPDEHLWILADVLDELLLQEFVCTLSRIHHHGLRQDRLCTSENLLKPVYRGCATWLWVDMDRLHKVTGDMTGSQLAWLVVFALSNSSVPKKDPHFYPSVISQGSNEMQKPSQKMKGKLISYNQFPFYWELPQTVPSASPLWYVG